jgi:hypothetical protein
MVTSDVIAVPRLTCDKGRNFYNCCLRGRYNLPPSPKYGNDQTYDPYR